MSISVIEPLDRAIIEATQEGLPLVPEPYHAVAERIGADPQLVMQRIAAMQQRGIIRRIGAVPNHYALGYKANGMTVTEIDVTPFKEATAGVYDKLGYGALRDQLQAIAAGE